MKKYNIYKVTKEKTTLLETINATDITAARKQATLKYMSIVLSTQTQLLVKAA